MFYRIFLIRILESLSTLLSRNTRISAEQYHPSAPSTNGKEPFSEIIRRASEKYGVEEKVIKAVIKQSRPAGGFSVWGAGVDAAYAGYC